MTIPNVITIGRIVLVPAIVWAMLNGEMALAFGLFVAAGVSDAIDGALARWLKQQSEFGTILDPIADKAMLVAVFVLLGFMEHIPSWLAILVVSRDIIIVAGVMIVFLARRPFEIAPFWVSKANTVAQILLAALVLGLLAFDLQADGLVTLLIYATAILGVVSLLAYIVEGFAVMERDAKLDVTAPGAGHVTPMRGIERSGIEREAAE
ncbi:MAG: CDP-alcohol phosphatidyltransferase family protein [Pseudomonadota bacterium]